MTIHEDAAVGLLEEFHATPAGAATLARMGATLYGDTYNRQLIAWVGQTQRDAAYWPAHQIAALTSVLDGLVRGSIVRRRIAVGETPGPDADREGNAAVLRRVKAPFRVKVDMTQNGADCDGILSWDEPIILWRALNASVLGEDGIYGPVHAPFEVRPWRAPLEIGYTLPSRTLAHLLMEGVVARWAYEDDEICLLLNLERIGPTVAVRSLPAGIKPFDIGL